MHGQPASPARHNYRFTIGEQECAEHHPACPELVPSGSVRHGDWAVAGECFGGGAGVCGAARPRRRAFSSWKWGSIELVASPESGSGATSEEPPSNRACPRQLDVSRA